MKNTTLILDLDGVLITTPPWKADKIDPDGYSKFNDDCIKNLNELLEKVEIEIWLSSTRRTVKTLDEFNNIFKNRKIRKSITGFVPVYENIKNRKEEVERFINERKLENYIILDDDKSLNELNFEMKKNLVLTELIKGFDQEKLNEAIKLIA